MDLYFQGKALLYKGWAPEYLEQAPGNFERALILDPTNVDAMAWMAAVDVIVGSNCIADDRTESGKPYRGGEPIGDRRT
jgi:hypothetical protein